MFGYLSTVLKVKMAAVVFVGVAFVLLVAAVIVWWKASVSDISIRPTGLNVLEILDKDQLLVAQQGVDFFLNTGDFTAIVPFTVKVGFDLKKKQERDALGTGKKVVCLPPPEILGCDKDEKVGEVVISDAPNNDLIKSLRVFGERYAEWIAQRRGLLTLANQRGKEIVEQWYKNSTQPVEIVTQPSAAEDIEATNEFLPVTATLPKDSLVEVVPENERTHPKFCFEFRLKGHPSAYAGLEGYMSCETTLEKGVPEKVAKCFDTKNPSRQFALCSQKDNLIVFYWMSNGIIYLFSFMDTDEKAMLDHLPDILPALYGLKDNPNWKPRGRCTDITGHTLKDIQALNLQQKRMFFAATYLPFFSLSSGALKEVAVLCGPEGQNAYRQDAGAVEKEIQEAVAACGLSSAEVVGMAYDYHTSTYHRNGLMFFLDDKALYYVPSRMVPPQSEIKTVISYKDFSDKTKVNDVSGGRVQINGVQVESNDICRFLRACIKEGFLHPWTCS